MEDLLQETFGKRTRADLVRLLDLLTAKPFDEFIAALPNPFRETTNAELVTILDRTFMAHSENNTLSVESFDRRAVGQLPNLLNTYINYSQPPFKFGEGDFKLDMKFVSLVHLIIRRGKSYKAFQDFVRAFPKADVLLKDYKHYDAKYKEIKERERLRKTRQARRSRDKSARSKSSRSRNSTLSKSQVATVLEETEEAGGGKAEDGKAQSKVYDKEL